jgi:hypothetical protein
MINYWVRLKVRNSSPVTDFWPNLLNIYIYIFQWLSQHVLEVEESGRFGSCRLPFGWYWLDFDNQIDRVNRWNPTTKPNRIHQVTKSIGVVEPLRPTRPPQPTPHREGRVALWPLQPSPQWVVDLHASWRHGWRVGNFKIFFYTRVWL